LKGERREETLIGASCRNAVQLIRLVTLVLLTKMDCVSWFHCALLQVPDLEVLCLVYREKFADTGGEPVLVAIESNGFFWSRLFCLWSFVVIEVEEAPLNLGDGGGAILVPNGHGGSVCLVV
jgi:hypothetical protein